MSQINMDQAVFSEIYIYCKYLNPGKSLSVFMGQREEIGQSPGNLGRGFGAWVNWGPEWVGIKLQQRSDLRLRVASTVPTPEDIVIRPESSHCVCWVQDWIYKISFVFIHLFYQFVSVNNNNQNIVIPTSYLKVSNLS